MIILPYSVSMAVVGLLESLMTATIVDDFTTPRVIKTRNAAGKEFQTSLLACLVVWPVAP